MRISTTLALAVLTLAVLIPFAPAGSVPGPGLVANAVAEAHGERTHYEQYYGLETAVLSLAGDGDTDLDIFVYDPAGRLVASGVGLTDRERVSWYVPVTGTYRIVVRNLGGVWNRYNLHTN